MSAAGKQNVTATYTEWQTDALDDVGANANVQGDDASTNTAVPTVRLRNYCQILDKVAQVSGTQEEIDKAGRKSEMAYQMAKRSRELKRDLEYALVQNQSSTSGGAGSAALMASVESWLNSRTASGQRRGYTSLQQTGTAATSSGYVSGTVAAPTDAATPGTLTEQALKSVIAELWDAGGDPSTIMVGAAGKQKISTSFAGIATRYRDVPSGKQAQVIGGVDLYISDFGEHRIVPNRFMRTRTVLALDMEYWAVGYLRGFRSSDLAKTGDSMRRQLLVEATLIAKNPAASGKIADVNFAL